MEFIFVVNPAIIVKMTHIINRFSKIEISFLGLLCDSTKTYGRNNIRKGFIPEI